MFMTNFQECVKHNPRKVCINTIAKEIEAELNEALIILPFTKGDEVFVASGRGRGLAKGTKPYTFLQNLTSMKAKLMKRGLTFRPVSRLTDDMVVQTWVSYPSTW